MVINDHIKFFFKFLSLLLTLEWLVTMLVTNIKLHI